MISRFTSLFGHSGHLAEVSLPEFEWPYLHALQRLGLALALGLLVGLERERRHKEAGLRTFALASLLGCLGGLLGESYALVSLGLLAILMVILNVQSLQARQASELTTSAALLVIGFAGVMCGQGHTLTPAALGVLTAALLAWKPELSGFSLGLSDGELRSAILLGILACVIYPALPATSIDRWGLIQPRAAWQTVLLIAGIGFANYILLKLYGLRALELTGFFGGLVNSTVTVAALAERVRETHGLVEVGYRGIVLATGAMVLRNAILLAILAPDALVSAAPALLLMFGACLGLVWMAGRPKRLEPLQPSALALQSPFSLWSALKFGLLFLALQIAGTLAQRWLGQWGFFVVSLVGGLISSASAVAAAGTLAAQKVLPIDVAGTGAVLASLMSTLVNFPLVARIGREQPLTRRIALALALVILVGIVGAIVGAVYVPMLELAR